VHTSVCAALAEKACNVISNPHLRHPKLRSAITSCPSACLSCLTLSLYSYWLWIDAEINCFATRITYLQPSFGSLFARSLALAAHCLRGWDRAQRVFGYRDIPCTRLEGC
jgi:hypothetical protein